MSNTEESSRSLKRKEPISDEIQTENTGSGVRVYYQHQVRFSIPPDHQVALSVYRNGEYIKTENILYDADIRFETVSNQNLHFYPYPPQVPVYNPIPPVEYTILAANVIDSVNPNQNECVTNGNLNALEFLDTENHVAHIEPLNTLSQPSYK